MCTARPNWLSLSTTFFNKDACHKVPIPLYDILELNEETMTVRVEPMVSVGDITRYLGTVSNKMLTNFLKFPIKWSFMTNSQTSKKNYIITSFTYK